LCNALQLGELSNAHYSNFAHSYSTRRKFILSVNPVDPLKAFVAWCSSSTSASGLVIHTDTGSGITQTGLGQVHSVADTFSEWSSTGDYVIAYSGSKTAPSGYAICSTNSRLGAFSLSKPCAMYKNQYGFVDNTYRNLQTNTTIYTYDDVPTGNGRMWYSNGYLFKIVSSTSDLLYCFEITDGNTYPSLELKWTKTVTAPTSTMNSDYIGSPNAPTSNADLMYMNTVNTGFAYIQDDTNMFNTLIGPHSEILYNSSDATATASNLLINKTAYSNTGKIVGSMPNNGTLNYTPNGSSQIIPAGYTSGGIVNAINLQSKTTTITQNGTQTITPDSGYDGLDEVEITTNVDSPLITITSSYTSTSFAYGGFACQYIPEINVKITQTGCAGLFYYFKKLKKVKIDFEVHPTNMSMMFYECRELEDIIMTGEDTSQVTDMSRMFDTCQKLTTIPSFSTASVTNMSRYVFSMCFSCCSTRT